MVLFWCWCHLAKRLKEYLNKLSVLRYIGTNLRGGGGGVGRGSVGRENDFWWAGPGFDSRCGRPLPTGSVGVSKMGPTLSPRSVSCVSVLGVVRDMT